MDIDLRTLIDFIATQPLGVGCFLAFAGTVFLMMGHRIFKTLVALSFFAFGFLLVSTQANTTLTALLGGVLAGLTLAMIGLKLQRVSVAVLAGGWSGFIVLQVGDQFEMVPALVCGTAAVAFICAFSLTFIIFDEIIAFVTSLEGTFLCIGGLVIFAAHTPGMWSHFQALLVSNLFFGPFLVLTGTVTGYYLQVADIRHKRTGGQQV